MLLAPSHLNQPPWFYKEGDAHVPAVTIMAALADFPAPLLVVGAFGVGISTWLLI
jgi:hypothetical protein